MQREKFNKDWKQDLEDVNNFSHAVLKNKNASWQKLYLRLDEKPRDKKVTLYWLAAASVLFLFMISLFEMRTTSNNEHNINAALNRKFIHHATETIKPVKPIISTATTKKPIQKDVAIKNHIQRLIVDSITIAKITTHKSDVLQSTEIKALPTADTMLITAVQPSLIHNKLRVIHVNESGEPIEFPSAVAHTSDLHLFQLKLAQQEIYNASTIASNNTSISFKPRNSPN